MPSQKFRVLVVDDEHLIADTLALIVSHSGHEALAVYSGREAIETAVGFNPQILISDVLMPGLDGIELAKHFVTHHQHCRVLLISGRAERTRVTHSLASQENSVQFLPKPILPQTVLAFIAANRNAK